MASNTIVLKGRGVRKEAQAAAAITPGHLVKLSSAGKYAVHATAGGKALPCFAVENELAGKGISTAYAADDTCFVEVVQAGSEVYALVAAAAPAITKGDLLESAGDGTLRKVANVLTDNSGGTADGTIAAVTGSYVEATMENNTADLAAAINGLKSNAIAMALETVDNSGGGSAVRIIVEVL